jgi:hypothetical protein
MSNLPRELDFAADRDASPDRMNAAMDYIVQRFKAIESVKPQFESAIQQLKTVGLERIDEFLTPLLTTAQGMVDEIVALEAALSTDAFRAALLADAISGAIAGSFGNAAQRASLIDDVIAEIASRQLYIEAGAGAAGIHLSAGSAPPSDADGADGDIYIQRS